MHFKPIISRSVRITFALNIGWRATRLQAVTSSNGLGFFRPNSHDMVNRISLVCCHGRLLRQNIPRAIFLNMVRHNFMSLLRLCLGAKLHGELDLHSLSWTRELTKQPKHGQCWPKTISGSRFFDKAKSHLYCPTGAVQKDGPSAGITMATLLSLNEQLDGTIAIFSKIPSQKLYLDMYPGIMKEVMSDNMTGEDERDITWPKIMPNWFRKRRIEHTTANSRWRYNAWCLKPKRQKR